jgi:hypothetical protein
MICKKDGCMADCRIKDAGKETVEGIDYTKQTYYCTLHGDRYSILRKEGYEDIIENIN